MQECNDAWTKSKFFLNMDYTIESLEQVDDHFIDECYSMQQKRIVYCLYTGRNKLGSLGYPGVTDVNDVSFENSGKVQREPIGVGSFQTFIGKHYI